MKRIQPSVRMKEEVEQLLRDEAVEGAPAETPMRGFVRSLAQYILQYAADPAHQATRTLSDTA